MPAEREDLCRRQRRERGSSATEDRETSTTTVEEREGTNAGFVERGSEVGERLRDKESRKGEESEREQRRQWRLEDSRDREKRGAD